MPRTDSAAPKQVIAVRGARVHNLKNISVDIPKNALVVVTGLSGSGKSSLAFDTIFAEGQRRYMESLSSYARQFLELQSRPDVDEITGLSPTIAIDQRTVSQNPRSTVGTITEMYDYLRLLFARAGTPHCPRCDAAVHCQTVDEIVEIIRVAAEGAEAFVFAPIVRDARGEHRHELAELEKAGYKDVRLDGDFVSIEEAQDRRIDKQKKHSISVLVARLPRGTSTKPEEIKKQVVKGLELGNSFLTLARAGSEDQLLSEEYACRSCGISLPPLEPRLFSFNSPHGACPECTGLGSTLKVEPSLVIPNPRLTIAQGAIKPWTRIAGNQNAQLDLVRAVGIAHGFSIDTPVADLSEAALKIVLYGTDDQIYTVGTKTLPYEGVIPGLEQKFKETDSDYLRKEIESYMRVLECPSCRSKRLRPEALAVKIGTYSIADLVALPVSDAVALFAEKNGNGKKNGNGHVPTVASLLTEDQMKIAKQMLKEIRTRLGHLTDVGVGYLTLDRSANTLSGGEAQRVRLATQLGTQLSGVIYILDEPSIGLHGRDNEKLIATMEELRDSGNTVIVVEHDEAIIRAADWVIDVGPGAGEYGGEIIAEGTPASITKNPESLTGAYLSGRKRIPAPAKYRKGTGKTLTVKGATEFNLKNIDVGIPLGTLVCVTGVSGSGKSTLVVDILARALSAEYAGAKALPGAHKSIKGIEYLDKVIAIDQTPIGRTPRSNPATYTGVFTAIRDLFTETQEAKLRKFDAGKFSFNVKGGGRCEACAGEGYVEIDMQFLPDVYMECKECHGKRYNAEALDVHYKGKNIADVLELTVAEARNFFADQPAIADKLGLLYEVGLGYIRLGQPATTLSGGEAQRVKLATELSRRATGRTLYILDEPTTGLHFEDIGRLLGVLNELVNKGNTVLIIEHNLEVIRAADWVVDMGPEGGARGGYIVAKGTPAEIAKDKASVTGQLLKRIL
ncbi:MAG: excinuclease ABC subunit UvrA [Patescibacteria group bacterium]